VAKTGDIYPAWLSVVARVDDVTATLRQLEVMTSPVQVTADIARQELPLLADSSIAIRSGQVMDAIGFENLTSWLSINSMAVPVATVMTCYLPIVKRM
jgi:hypothetical protein